MTSSLKRIALLKQGLGKNSLFETGIAGTLILAKIMDSTSL